MRFNPKILALLGATVVLAACGNSGKLYLPEKRSADAPTTSTTGTTEEATEKARKKELPPAKEQ